MAARSSSTLNLKARSPCELGDIKGFSDGQAAHAKREMTDFTFAAGFTLRALLGGSAAALAAGTGWVVAQLPWQLGLLLALLFLFSPNFYSWVAYGTPNLLLADGYTMESLLEERRAS